MASYVIGDIQGCFDEFMGLISLIEFNPILDKVYLVGDLVNRGPRSLDVLRYVYANRESFKMVLGNHDLHLLACWAGISKPKSLDTFNDVLHGAEVNELMSWLRKQPLVLELPECLIVHAGINPSLSWLNNLELAMFCSEKLAADDFYFWLSNMYGSSPTKWADGMEEVERFRFGINTFTRMRMLDGCDLDMKFKGTIESAPDNLRPWFNQLVNLPKPVMFGHWSALGLVVNEKVVALDTGCIWGGQLTAICLDSGCLFQYPALVGARGGDE